MCLLRRVPATIAVVLLMSGSAFAQGWIEYTSRQDRFSVNFPGDPRVEELKYTSFLEGVFPARVYSALRGQERFSVTVVDFTDAERVHAERRKNCSPGAQSLCLGTGDDGHQGVGGWKYDILGAPDFATWKIMERHDKLTFFAWANIDRIQGRQIHFTDADGSRTFAAIHMHEDRLYVFEATVPKGSPEPGLFQQSPRFLDADGKVVRYELTYANGLVTPPRTAQGN
jgi:hypothetical protein